MGSYRADRIRDLLSENDSIRIEDVQTMHYDVHSRQADIFMEIIRPLLPETEKGRILKDWDLCYNIESEGAFLFEQVYRALYALVFGHVLGAGVEAFLANETGVFIDFYENFDRILLSENSSWFGDRSRVELFREAVSKGLNGPVKRWGEINRFELTHMLLGNALPKFLGFDRGPFPMPGSRATIHQGQIYRSAGRQTSFAPSYRFVTDLSENTLYSNISGGVSDRRFSRFYLNDFRNWQLRSYKKITL